MSAADSADLETTAQAVVACDPHVVAAHVWRNRRHVELDAAKRFERMAADLETVGGHRQVRALCVEAAADERRHAVLCEDLVRHFGEEVGDDKPRRHVRVAAGLDMTAHEALLYEVVALSCVTETLSTALLGELVACATDDVANEAMREILKDEVGHSRLGWAHLAVEHGVLERDVVGPRLAAMLRATVRDTLFDGEPEHPAQQTLTGLGSLPKSRRASIVHQALTDVVFPGLRKFGIDTREGERWLADHATLSAS